MAEISPDNINHDHKHDGLTFVAIRKSPQIVTVTVEPQQKWYGRGDVDSSGGARKFF